MSQRKIIIDCDPGQDDAVMLLMALASPEDFDILGITTVAGNVPLQLTQRNARLVCDLAGRNDVPIYAGCDRPLARELVTAEFVHGQTGIDGMDIRPPQTPIQARHAVDFIIETLTVPGGDPVTLVLTGPLTNLATAMGKRPDIVPRIAEIVLMGGAMREGGNATPSAEFNIYVDPQAAQTVIQCGRPISVAGLDVTHQALVRQDCLARLRALGTRATTATVGMLEFFNRYDREKYHSEGAPLHDPCTIAYLLQPSLFRGKLCNLEIETESELTAGHTAVDFWQVTGRPANVNWLYEVDARGFFDLLIDRLSRLRD
ncbi:MAG: nucleoside hydrolase [Xanthomonadales bacterium]|nr:nucleoside hydrolase [Xanthomonadales bacterium]